MTDEPDDYLNDPIDDEFDAAVLAAEELVIRTRTVGLDKLELRIPDQSGSWTVTVRKTGTRGPEEPSADGHSGNGARHDGNSS
jgi:hypothetical protein